MLHSVLHWPYDVNKFATDGREVTWRTLQFISTKTTW